MNTIIDTNVAVTNMADVVTSRLCKSSTVFQKNLEVKFCGSTVCKRLFVVVCRFQSLYKGKLYLYVVNSAHVPVKWEQNRRSR